MLKITKHLCAVLICALTLTSCSKDTDVLQEQSNLKTEILSDNVAYSNIELEILTAVNSHRQSLGLNKLGRIDDITFQAEDHTNYMVENKLVNHSDFDKRFKALVKDVGASSVSENVGYGYRTAAAVVQAWLASEGHKANIEGDFTHFGIAVDSDDNGKNYFTNIFVKRK